MKRAQQGFTLIELMIVVAIIGILAAVAIPAYQDYTTRAKVTEGIGVAAAAKTSVSEYYLSEGSFPTTSDEAGVGTIATDYVKSVVVGKSGVITVTFKGDNFDGNTIVFKPTAAGGSVKWQCDQGDMPDKYLPANCR